MYLTIEKTKGSRLTQQIYTKIRTRILNGELKPGEKLPSSRKMAKDLGVSRNTVLAAYDFLFSEGYIAGKTGAGMFVSPGMELPKQPEAVRDYALSVFSPHEITKGEIGFYPGTPDVSLFPRPKWNKALGRAIREAPDSAFGYDYPQGRPELRNVLRDYLKRARGISCDPEQIIVTTGTKQSLTLAGKCLLAKDSEVLIEDPGNGNVKDIFSFHTEKIYPLPADGEGIMPSGFARFSAPSLIFTTPSNAFPLGGALPIARRLALIRYAREKGAWILEDDYDSEFCYQGPPVHALQALAPDIVVYTGTFSKIMFPSVRLGYMVLPYPLVNECRRLKHLCDHHTSSLTQLALMEFIESGELERHVFRMKRLYKKRRDFLISLLLEYFPGKVTVWGGAAGMHVAAQFPGVSFPGALFSKIKAAGVGVVPVSEHTLQKGKYDDMILLGFGNLPEEKIKAGLSVLKKILSEEKRS